jgi:hypothetical protein
MNNLLLPALLARPKVDSPATLTRANEPGIEQRPFSNFDGTKLPMVYARRVTTICGMICPSLGKLTVGLAHILTE